MYELHVIHTLTSYPRIRNPLSAVLHLAEEVKEITKEIATEHDEIRDQVADILDAADTILLCVSHQNTLVDDILSFSKLDSMMLSLVPRGKLCFLSVF
jgi:signal transduction histidine kinase